MDAFGLVCSSTNTELSFSLWLCSMAKSTQHRTLSEAGWKKTNCANRPERKKKTHWVSILRQWWGQMSAEQEMLGLQVHRSDTPIYSHIEKRPHVDSYHKISVIWEGLGPLADLLEEREQWCRFTLGNKTGRRKLPGSKLLRSGESSCIKAAASECMSSLKLRHFLSLAGISSAAARLPRRYDLIVGS